MGPPQNRPRAGNYLKDAGGSHGLERAVLARAVPARSGAASARLRTPQKPVDRREECVLLPLGQRVDGLEAFQEPLITDDGSAFQLLEAQDLVARHLERPRDPREQGAGETHLAAFVSGERGLVHAELGREIFLLDAPLGARLFQA